MEPQCLRYLGKFSGCDAGRRRAVPPAALRPCPPRGTSLRSSAVLFHSPPPRTTTGEGRGVDNSPGMFLIPVKKRNKKEAKPGEGSGGPRSRDEEVEEPQLGRAQVTMWRQPGNEVDPRGGARRGAGGARGRSGGIRRSVMPLKNPPDSSSLGCACFAHFFFII